MKFACVGDRNGSSGNEIGQSPRPARCSWPASVNDTPSSPSPRISVSFARAACIAPPKYSVLRPGLPPGFAPPDWTGCCCDGRGPTRVWMPSKFTGATIFDPQFGQYRLLAVTWVPHFPQVAPLPSTGGGGLVARRGRGSSATAAPHRLHCGTPIGVSALTAWQERPKSITSEIHTIP